MWHDGGGSRLEPGSQWSYDVVIVGYGPVGQALAAMLGQAGHRVGVFERWPSLYPLPRACVVDHEAMRILQSVSVAEPFSRLAVPTGGEYVWLNAAGQTLYHFRHPRDGVSGWPSRSLIYQPDLEQLLDHRVKSIPQVDVHQGFEVTGLRSDADGVVIEASRCEAGEGGRLQRTEDRRSISAKWVVGCDGANSFVRQASGIAWEDLGFRADWLVVDVMPNDPTRELDMPEAAQICDPARPVTLMRRMGLRHVRWEMMLLPGEDPAEICQHRNVWPMIERWIRPDQGKIDRAAVYTFQSGVAGTWRKGRVLLAGDAAHLMPPFLGQGLCSGLRDARALFWRLDDVLAGRHEVSVLDLYEQERAPHVKAVIERAVALGKVVCITDPVEAARRDEGILSGKAPDLPQFPTMTTGLLHWPGVDAVAGELGPQPVVATNGQTGLLDDVIGTGWHLLVDNDRGPLLLDARHERWAATTGLRTIFLGDRDRGEKQCLDLGGNALQWLRSRGLTAVLVRPDFYVFGGAAAPADVSSLLDDLQRQLRSTMKVPA
jgi:2-polyprenyl-6-methoxyphenol hydroxylase-like FAD-dependent oxidoreductase